MLGVGIIGGEDDVLAAIMAGAYGSSSTTETDPDVGEAEELMKCRDAVELALVDAVTTVTLSIAPGNQALYCRTVHYTVQSCI